VSTEWTGEEGQIAQRGGQAAEVFSVEVEDVARLVLWLRALADSVVTFVGRPTGTIVGG
jgi:hypothetical protein